MGRHGKLEHVLARVVDNGLKSERLSSGHEDKVGQRIPLLNSSGAEGSSITTRGSASGEDRRESGSAL